MKERSGEPWMAADAYGRSLRGMGVNLLVREVARSVAFLTEVLALDLVYADADFAVLRYGNREGGGQEGGGQDVILHADHTYAEHPLLALTGDGALRGAGVEMRLYGIDPDAAEARARTRGDAVFAATQDKPHGLRECYLADPDGYIWVPGIGIG
jgi:catechol 2,3-dioxygenase-like lactoylglutathione lyase family enzyme